MGEIRVERTGAQYSMASSEYRVTFPDGTTMTIWSPPWHEMAPDEEDERAMDEARRLWVKRQEQSKP